MARASPRLLVISLSWAGLVAGQLDKIRIFSKPARPMAYETASGKTIGYSIDFWTDYVAPKLEISDIKVRMLGDNDEIMGDHGLGSDTCSNANVLCVGAAQTNQYPTTVASFSSRGPSKDQRIKPDVVAPGKN